MVKIIDKRGLWWKNISKQDRSKRLSANRKAGWSKVSSKDRTKLAIKLNEARWGKKKLST